MLRNLKHESDVAEDVFGWLGSAISLFFNAGPIVQVIRTFQGKCPYQDMNWISLACNFVNGTIWAAYGIRKQALQLYVCNGTCALISLIYLCIYLVYVADKKLILSFVYIIDYLALSLELFWIFFGMVGEKEVAGYFAMVINIFVYAAPGIRIFQTIKTMDHTLLPIHISILGCICSACWLIYGIYMASFSVCIPNGLCVFFAVLQIVVWGIAKCKGGSQAQNKEIPVKTVPTEKKKEDGDERKQTTDSDNVKGLIMVQVERKAEEV